MDGHVHATYMVEYAKDAQKYSQPWLAWQRSDDNGQNWIQLTTHPDWIETSQYRRLVPSFPIAGTNVPMPYTTTTPPAVGQTVYVVDLTKSSKYDIAVWASGPGFDRVLGRGIVHRTGANAVKHADALLSFSLVL